jgi:hypothetical protein
MHIPSPKIKKDIEFLKVLTVKKLLKKPENWTIREIEVIVTNSPGLKPRQEVLLGDLQTLHYHLGDMDNLTPKIREDMVF